MSDEQTLPTGTQIYDRLMSTIDLDLISTSLPTLEARYAATGETPEQKAVRQARYKESFAKYDVLYAQFLVNLHKEVTSTKREARIAAEMEEQADEQKKQSELLAQMASL
jgi:hypothetical protein